MNSSFFLFYDIALAIGIMSKWLCSSCCVAPAVYVMDGDCSCAMLLHLL